MGNDRRALLDTAGGVLVILPVQRDDGVYALVPARVEVVGRPPGRLARYEWAVL